MRPQGGKSQNQVSKTTISIVRTEEMTANPRLTPANSSKRAQVEMKLNNDSSANAHNVFRTFAPQTKTKSTTQISSGKKHEVMTTRDEGHFNSGARRNTQPDEARNDDSHYHSRSFERAGSANRPRSAAKDRSRDYGNNHSQYSAAYSRILNPGEVRKIKRLVGEQNSDLDVG